MDGVSYWRACKTLTVVQAILLILGRDPAAEAHYVEDNAPEHQPPGYLALRTALIDSMMTELGFGNIIQLNRYDADTGQVLPIPYSVDVTVSTIEVSQLKPWLVQRRIPSDFFLPEISCDADYLDKSNQRYAPKLAAAVNAWVAIGDEPLAGRTPKQVLQKWLRDHAAEFGLCGEDGRPNETGIEEVAKVANWQPGGGAPKTLG